MSTITRCGSFARATPMGRRCPRSPPTAGRRCGWATRVGVWLFAQELSAATDQGGGAVSLTTVERSRVWWRQAGRHVTLLVGLSAVILVLVALPAHSVGKGFLLGLATAYVAFLVGFAICPLKVKRRLERIGLQSGTISLVSGVVSIDSRAITVRLPPDVVESIQETRRMVFVKARWGQVFGVPLRCFANDLVSGMVIPVSKLPGAMRTVSEALPSEALSHVRHRHGRGYGYACTGRARGVGRRQPGAGGQVLPLGVLP
jgi:hypothetical protein